MMDPGIKDRFWVAEVENSNFTSAPSSHIPPRTSPSRPMVRLVPGEIETRVVGASSMETGNSEEESADQMIEFVSCVCREDILPPKTQRMRAMDKMTENNRKSQRRFVTLMTEP